MKVYRVLLLAFPRRVRREFGPDMERMFEEQRLLARRDGTGLIRLWAMAAWDALRYGLGERLAGDRSGHRTRTPRQPWRTYMTALLQDLRYVRRLLAAQPGVSAIAVVTLALGVGANAAVFSAVDALLLRPLPYADADRLVMVWEKREAEGVLNNVVAPADYLDRAEMNSRRSLVRMPGSSDGASCSTESRSRWSGCFPSPSSSPTRTSRSGRRSRCAACSPRQAGSATASASTRG